MIDAIQIFDRALSAEEVAALHRQQFTLGELCFLWLLCDESQTPIPLMEKIAGLINELSNRPLDDGEIRSCAKVWRMEQP